MQVHENLQPEETRVYHVLVPEATEDKPSLIRMVGTGTMCENSGIVLNGVCSSCGHTLVLSKANCGRIECPHCFRTWARRASERAAVRVFGYRYATGTHHKPRHVTIELSSLDWDEAKKKFLSIGATGGVLVIHPWRIKKECEDYVNSLALRDNLNRYEVVRRHTDPLSLLEYSPHAHGIVYGRLVDVEKNSCTYLYKNIRRINNQKAAEQLMFYLLGHTNIPKSKRTSSLRYFGVCSPQKLKPSWQGKCNDSLPCPVCGKPVLYEGTHEEILIRKYISLGWIVTSGKNKKKAPPPFDEAINELDPCLLEEEFCSSLLPPGQMLLFESSMV